MGKSDWPTASAINARIDMSNAANGRVSKLTGMGAAFLELGERIGVNPGVVTAILQRESQLGADGSFLPENLNNFGGLTGTGNAGSTFFLDRNWGTFATPADGLKAVFDRLAGDPYRPTGGRLRDIMSLYSPPFENDWPRMWEIFAIVGNQLGITIDENTQIYERASTGQRDERGEAPMSDVVNVPVLVHVTPWSNPNRDGTKLDLGHGGLRLTIHDTGNVRAGADAQMHDTWQDSTGSGGGGSAGVMVAVHFYVDDQRIVQKLPLDEIGYHAGDGCNDVVSDVGCFRSVAIEMCVNVDADHTAVARNCAQLVARICANDSVFDWGDGATKGKFSIDRLDQHIWISQEAPPHDCPHSLRYADYGTDWNEWLAMVDSETDARTSPARKPAAGTPDTPAPKPKRKPRREYRRPAMPPFLKQTPLPERVIWKGTEFAIDGSFWKALKETPVLTTAARRSASTRRPLTQGEAARIAFTFESDGEAWGLTPQGSRIPLRDMLRIA